MWTVTDFSLKKFLNRRVTSSVKKYYEEFGDVAIDIHSSEVKYSVIPIDDPAQAVLDGVAELRTLFVLTVDNSVANNQTWYAADGPTRLKNWISDKYGDSYLIKLYDNTNNQIYPTDTLDWLFDYTTGVLMINGNAGAFAQPFKITGYRYTGEYLSDVILGASGGHQILFNSIPLPQRSKLNFLGTIYNLTDDSLNDQTLVATNPIAAPGVSYVPTTPADWSYSGAPTDVAEALDGLAHFVSLTAPVKASLFTGQALTFAGTTLYTGKIAGGLPASWYTMFPAGTTVTNVVYTGTFTLSFLNFRAGLANQTATYGTITANFNGVDVNSYNMASGPGSSGIIQALNFGVFNAVWEKADGVINASQVLEGAGTYIMKHTEAGNSNAFSVHFDDSSSAVSFPVGLAVAVNVLAPKWLSGLSYLGLGTTLNVSFTIQNVFRKVYMPSGVAVFSMPGSPNVDFDPPVVPNFGDNFATSGVVTLSIGGIVDLAPLASVVARKPNNLNAANSNFAILTISNGISTHGIVSTAQDELFHDEDKRLNATALTAFDSTTALANEEALVIPGVLKFNVAGDPTQYYVRRFDKVAANNGHIVMTGAAIDIPSPYNTGNFNVLLKLETENLWFDLGRPFGLNNGTGDGSSEANSIGARVSFESGDFGFSFGTYSTANNNDQYLMRIIMKSGASDIYSLATT